MIVNIKYEYRRADTLAIGDIVRRFYFRLPHMPLGKIVSIELCGRGRSKRRNIVVEPLGKTFHFRKTLYDYNKVHVMQVSIQKS